MSQSYYLKHREEILKKKREDKDVINARRRENKKAYAWQRDYHRERRHTDSDYRLRCNLRNRLHHALKGKCKLGSHISLLGCTASELRKHLESKFKPDMSWENYSHAGWHVDHIIPLSKFNLEDPNELRRACHYTNLQPLWAADNFAKSNT